jgi:hypothetical protein
MSVTADNTLYTADSHYPTADGFVPAVTVEVSPSLHGDDDTVHAPGIGIEGGEQTLSAELFDDADVFYVPIAQLPGAEQTLAPALYDDADVFHASNIGAEGEVELPPVRPISAMRRQPRKLPRAQLVASELYIDSDVIYSPSIALTEDVVSAPPIQPELPLVELRSVTKALPTDASSPPVSIVSAKPRIATTLRPMIAEPHVVAGAANAVVIDESDEEIMLILLEAA